VIEADSLEEAQEILGEMDSTKHDWHDVEITNIETEEEE
jgi:hypothetical protein